MDSSQKIKGTLAYFAIDPDGGGYHYNPVIVLRSLGGTRLLPVDTVGTSGAGTPGANARSDIASYGFRIEDYGSGNPQLSPDGQVFAYEQLAWVRSYGGSSLYEWDMKAGKVRRLVNKTIAYLNFFWSPDSQSIAYVSGGEDTNQPAQLNIVERSTGKNQTIALPKGVSLMLATPVKLQAPIVPFAWASPTSLLFSGLPDEGADKYTLPRPRIYEATNGKTNLVVPDAYAPSPSPDGRWIACFGWPDVNADETKKPSLQILPALYLYDRLQKKRLLVSALPKFGRREMMNGAGLPQQILRWTPDSRHLILTEETYQTKGKIGEAAATISAVDIPSQLPANDAQWAQTRRLITTLHTEDFVAYPSPILHYEMHFRPLQMSADENHLFLATFQVTGQTGDNPTSESSLQRLNLTNGQVDVLARFNNYRLRGFDWHEQLQ